jgi:hypothetical protein
MLKFIRFKWQCVAIVLDCNKRRTTTTTKSSNIYKYKICNNDKFYKNTKKNGTISGS